MSKKYDVQVPKSHYFKRNYDDLQRFVSYFYQIDLTRSLGPKKVLEIGIGNKTVSNYLKSCGLSVTTCDIDKSLEPDFVSDIRELPFEDGAFDVVLACEILEHMKWEDAKDAIKELHRVSKKHVIISVPYPSMAYFEAIIKFPFIYRMLKRHSLNLFFRIPIFYKKFVRSGEHFWEMGSRDYPIGRVRKALKERFHILREVRPQADSYHHFFVLEKRRARF